MESLKMQGAHALLYEKESVGAIRRGRRYRVEKLFKIR
jgi:hypothetical protein